MTGKDQPRPLARILLKGRPTPAQLADRLQPPWAEGLELYLAVEDLDGSNWLPTVVERLAAHPTPPGFTLIVEGPLRSLDGSFFDLSRDTEANREVLRRLAVLGGELGASAANIHLIAPTPSAADLASVPKRDQLRRMEPLLHHYVGVCARAGLRPLLENIPPVARMREGSFSFTPIGVEPEDFAAVAELEPEVGFTLDLSHAQLYLNALRAAPSDIAPELAPLVEHLRRGRGPMDLDVYVDALAPRLVNVHVSNATGLLGEGLPYSEGDADLDRVLARLFPIARYVVTEILEPEPDHCVYMREAQLRMAALRRTIQDEADRELPGEG